MTERILIVDDSKAMRLIVRRTLRQAGFGDYTVDEASNGREALEMLQTSVPKLVLCDWNMPEMTGIELLRELSSRKLPVKLGFVTTEATPEMRAMAEVAGAFFLIAKPFTPEQFEQTLRRFLA